MVTANTKRIILDLTSPIQAMNQQTLFTERASCDTAVALEEMLKQSVDFLAESTPNNNYFQEKHRIPHLAISMIKGASTVDRQTREELTTAFTHLYVNVRDLLDRQFGASAHIQAQGGFDFYLERMLGSNSAVLRQFNS